MASYGRRDPCRADPDQPRPGIWHLDDAGHGRSGLVDAIRAELTPTNPDPERDRLLSIPDAADALGIARSMLYGEIGRGRIRTVKVGRRRLAPTAAVRDYIDHAA